MTDQAADMDAIRDRLVLSALSHVPFDGWSKAALNAAAKDCGFDEAMGERAFPGGAIDAIDHWTRLADRKLEEEAANADFAAMRIPGRIAWLIRRRIEAWADAREAVRRAVSMLALPSHAARAARLTWRTADTLWHAAGDDSTDFRYYTKRATLSGIYGATLLVWLEDKSEDFADSWAFLDRRIADTGRIGKLRERMRPDLSKLRDPFGMRRRAGRRRRS
jgi:ubiquinone biosynthesis protein COQ9